jgi:hypothetical protein
VSTLPEQPKGAKRRLIRVLRLGLFLPYFTKIFNLRIDDDTMRRRLQERTDDELLLYGSAGDGPA